ncbi:MAG: DUF3141 domain-containing protein [Candidatus Muiribacteriota bacterium]
MDNIFSNYLNYIFDRVQRSVLLVDALRQRGDNYLRNQNMGQQPFIAFSYKRILDGRNFIKPVNYALIQIIDDRYKYNSSDSGKEKSTLADIKSNSINHSKMPIVIFSARSGGAPGLESSQNDSQVGIALKNGHPVYYVVYEPEPIYGQTVKDIYNAKILFLEKVNKLHPKAPRPAIIGNCQAGCSAVILSAIRSDLTGPLLLSGTALSFWSGVDGGGPLRYKAGLLGGSWFNSFLTDLGDGLFDGAHFIQNFKNTDPVAQFKEFLDLFHSIDTNVKTFLISEILKGSFYFFNDEEINFIISELFVRNKLIQGTLEIEDGKQIDLKNINSPVFVFASGADSITSIQQALNWIHEVYETVEEIKMHNQVIVYTINPIITHLDLFLSTEVIKKEHQEIFESIEMVDFLSPGLYEMVIDEKSNSDKSNSYRVSFNEREMTDIMIYDDGPEKEEAFKHVVAISEINDKFYRTFLSPFVKRFTTKTTAETFKLIHPLRAQRYIFSSLNPFVRPFKIFSEQVRKNRIQIEVNNIFSIMEKGVTDFIIDSLTLFGDASDKVQEELFYNIYSNPAMEILFGNISGINDYPVIKEEKGRYEYKILKADEKKWRDLFDKGGYPEGLIRLMLVLASVDGIVNKADITAMVKIIKSHSILKNLSQPQLKKIALEQARILQTDRQEAIHALSKLITTKKDKASAMKIAKEIVFTDSDLDEKDKRDFNKIENYIINKC